MNSHLADRVGRGQMRMVITDEAGAARFAEIDGNYLRVCTGTPPIGLMVGYADSAERTETALGGSHYGTSDVARQDADGFYWFVGRTDNVFKSSDYRISPFELESVLIEHPAVAEAAVIESPDPKRLCVPKACLVLAPNALANADTAESIFLFVSARVAPFKRIRIIEFCELPKTVSGKIRRNELRTAESERQSRGERSSAVFLASDFPATARQQTPES